MKKIALQLAFAGLSICGAANATTITFSETGSANNTFLSTDGTILAEYVWSTGMANGHSHQAFDQGNPYERGHGQPYQGLRFSAVGGGTLTLSSFDFQGAWMVGSLNNGTGSTYSTGLGAWATQNVGLTSSNPIYIYATGNYQSAYLDNVVFGETSNDVPEPASAMLFVLGLIGLAAARKKAARK